MQSKWREKNCYITSDFFSLHAVLWGSKDNLVQPVSFKDEMQVLLKSCVLWVFLNSLGKHVKPVSNKTGAYWDWLWAGSKITCPSHNWLILLWPRTLVSLSSCLVCSLAVVGGGLTCPTQGLCLWSKPWHQSSFFPPFISLQTLFWSLTCKSFPLRVINLIMVIIISCSDFLMVEYLLWVPGLGVPWETWRKQMSAIESAFSSHLRTGRRMSCSTVLRRKAGPRLVVWVFSELLIRAACRPGGDTIEMQFLPSYPFNQTPARSPVLIALKVKRSLKNLSPQ